MQYIQGMTTRLKSTFTSAVVGQKIRSLRVSTDSNKVFTYEVLDGLSYDVNRLKALKVLGRYSLDDIKKAYIDTDLAIQILDYDDDNKYCCPYCSDGTILIWYAWREGLFKVDCCNFKAEDRDYFKLKEHLDKVFSYHKEAIDKVGFALV